MARIGKIARLPLPVRNVLNRRMQDGEPGVKLVAWLNGREDVQGVLAAEFGGRPVTEQNLSEWRQGGHQDWLRHAEALEFVQNLAEESDELGELANGQEISDRFGAVLAAEMVRLAGILLEKETNPEKRWRRLQEINREFSQIRRDDHRAVRTLITRDRWNRQTELEVEEKDKKSEKERREKLCAPFWATLSLKTLAEVFGGGDHGREVAAFVLECQRDLPPGSLVNLARKNPGGNASPSLEKSEPPAPSGAIRPNPAESNQLKE